MTEQQFQDWLEGAATRFGWIFYHTVDSRRCHEGYPDVEMVHRKVNVKIIAELKSEKGQPTHDQWLWLMRLQACGEHAFLWRPADMPDIEEALRLPYELLRTGQVKPDWRIEEI